MPYPINPDPQEGETGVNIFGYTPSLATAVVAIAVFGLLTGANVFLLILRRRSRFVSYHA